MSNLYLPNIDLWSWYVIWYVMTPFVSWTLMVTQGLGVCYRSACVSPDCASDAGSVVRWCPAGRRCDGQHLLSGDRSHGHISDLQPHAVPVSNQNTLLCTRDLRQHGYDPHRILFATPEVRGHVCVCVVQQSPCWSLFWVRVWILVWASSTSSTSWWSGLGLSAGWVWGNHDSAFVKWTVTDVCVGPAGHDGCELSPDRCRDEELVSLSSARHHLSAHLHTGLPHRWGQPD